MSAHISRATRPIVIAAGVFAAALMLAACGGGSSTTASSSSGNSAKKTTAAAASGQTVATGKTSAGTVLVNSTGMTLYEFAADSPGKSNCTGSCLSYWPPVIVKGTPTHSSAVTGTVATIKRSDGSTQLTVNGWPLYTYAADSAPGQVTGQGLNLSGGLWWAASPSGSMIKTGGSGGSSSSSSGPHGY
jgi:predicted lipoprotein with Yx(FWY)xxD motif